MCREKTEVGNQCFKGMALGLVLTSALPRFPVVPDARVLALVSRALVVPGSAQPRGEAPVSAPQGPGGHRGMAGSQGSRWSPA